LSKKFTVDFLTKKQKVNTGEVPQYFVENSHEAIIGPVGFDMVQAELARQKNWARVIPVTVFSHQKLFVGSAESFMALRFGTAIANTNAPFGSAIINSRVTRNVGHHIYMRKI